MCDFRFSGKEFDGLRHAAEEFGEFIKNMAEEAGFGEAYSPFGAPFDRKGPFHRPYGEESAGWKNYTDFGYPRTAFYKNADGALVFEFLLPGFDEKNINISFRGNSMILKARLSEAERERNQNQKDRRRGFTLRDIDRKEYGVPADLYDQAAASAVFRNGILTVTIPEKDMSDDPSAIKVTIVKEGN